MKEMTKDELVSELANGVRRFEDISFRHDLSSITIDCAVFSNCDFTAVNLSNTRIQDSCFHGCDLEDATMIEVEVADTIFNCTSFRSTYIERSKLTEVTFKECYFRYTSFIDTVLNIRAMHFCSFLNAQIKECGLTISELTRTTFDSTEGLDVYSVGPVGVLNGNVTYFPSLNKVFAGCWQGNEEEFFAKCTEVTIKHDAELNLDLATDMVKRFMKKGE